MTILAAFAAAFVEARRPFLPAAVFFGGWEVRTWMAPASCVVLVSSCSVAVIWAFRIFWEIRAVMFFVLLSFEGNVTA